MADFVQIVKDWKRMCNKYFDGENWACNKTCPIYGFDVCSKPTAKYPAPLEVGQNLAHEIERVITAWAAEHPEPVYPTWVEYFRKIGIAPEDQIAFHSWLMQPIPADIAEKLGIEPKEG